MISAINSGRSHIDPYEKKFWILCLLKSIFTVFLDEWHVDLFFHNFFNLKLFTRKRRKKPHLQEIDDFLAMMDLCIELNSFQFRLA